MLVEITDLAQGGGVNFVKNNEFSEFSDAAEIDTGSYMFHKVFGLSHVACL